jgi:hypothetical protein
MLDKLEWLTSEVVHFDGKENPWGKPKRLVSSIIAQDKLWN